MPPEAEGVLMTATQEPTETVHRWDPAVSAFPAPDLARTGRVIGPVTNVDRVASCAGLGTLDGNDRLVTRGTARRSTWPA